jgi:hypothetical protein
MDWSEGLFSDDPEPGGVEGDPCTSATCPIRYQCARFNHQAPLTAISDKHLAATDGESCPFFSPKQDRYPENLRHPLLVWTDKEEDQQYYALDWFMRWRSAGDIFVMQGEEGYFTSPPESAELWQVHKARMLDWAWAEEGGVCLQQIHDMLLERNHIRYRKDPKNFTHPRP